VLAVAGIAVALRDRIPAAAAIAAIAVWSTLDHALLVAEPRHNMPLMPALVAVSFAGLAHRLRGRAAGSGTTAPRSDGCAGCRTG
jgi:hypothetical protein